MGAVTIAALFLRQLRDLQVKQNGILVRRVLRESEENDCLMIQTGNGQPQVWRLFRGEFEVEAKHLREAHPQIERKRRSQVVVAIPDGGLTDGRLFAVLPSETTIPLPFHINADFFPSSDRKHILFSEDYQGKWNCAAIRAAARALATGLEKLPGIMSAASLWQLIKSLDDCSREVDARRQDQAFKSFWQEAAPRLSDLPLIYTATGHWVKPRVARLLESEAELNAAPILNNLGIQTVHPELREYFGLLRRREIGVQLLNVQDIVRALETAGLQKGQLLAQAPEALRTLEAWHTLWKALDAILKRPQQSVQEKENARRIVGDCPIALDETRSLYPPCQLFQGDEEMRQIFGTVRWLSHEVEESKFLADLVPSFSPCAAIDFLGGIAAEQLEADWQAGNFDLLALYRWFELHKAEILSDESLRKKLHALAIWPSAGHLRPLDGLYIPSGFEDPFKISALVDIEALGGRCEFLKDLGVQELTFEVYAREQISRALQEKRDLAVEQRRQIVQLLAKRLGELRDDAATRDVIRQLPLVECTDGVFRAAELVYLPSTIMDVLDESTIFVAATPGEQQEAIFEFYRWLGIGEEPRPKDLLKRIRSICALPPRQETRNQIAVVFEYLANNWAGWQPRRQQEFSSLRDMLWLPGTRQGGTRWYKPSELYAVFQRHLFETQANFLDLPYPLQSKAATAGLIDYLGIQETPRPTLVVAHLLKCSQDKQPVNPGVYSFLDQSVEDPALDHLKNQACLLLSDGNYVRPDQVFWGQHPFGRFRYQLGQEFRRYVALLDRLKIRESPCLEDYIRVLLDISEQYGQFHRVLDEETLKVVLLCWETLSRAYEKGELQPADLSPLRSQPVIPNEQHILIQPEGIFFEDRPGLKEKLPQLGPNVIKRPQNAWRAMESAGVKLLSQAVQVELVEPLDRLPDKEVARHFNERLELIKRVIEASEVEGLDMDVLSRLSFDMTHALVVRYVLNTRYHRHESEPESLSARFFPTSTLVICYEDGRISWPAVAHEIAYAVKPFGEIGGLASGIKEALEHGSFEEASRVLDKLGYPHFSAPPDFTIPERPPVSSFGGIDRLEIVRGSAPSTPINESQDNDREILPGSGVSNPQIDQPSATNPDSTHVSRPEKPRRETHIVTYVDHDGAKSSSLPEEKGRQAQRTQVEEAGIKRVMDYEVAHGREPEEMPHLNPGFDIRSVDSRGEVRYIEVKALSGRWEGPNPAQLTRNEFETAREKEDEYWLYVVEFAASAEARVYPIQNPVGWIQRYLFDNGWMKLAKETPTQVEHGGNM